METDILDVSDNERITFSYKTFLNAISHYDDARQTELKLAYQGVFVRMIQYCDRLDMENRRFHEEHPNWPIDGLRRQPRNMYYDENFEVYWAELNIVFVPVL